MSKSSVYILAKRLWDKKIYGLDKMRKLVEIGELQIWEFEEITGVKYEEETE